MQNSLVRRVGSVVGIVAIIAAIFVTAGCSGSTDKVDQAVPVTTVTTSDPVEVAKCTSVEADLTSTWTEQTELILGQIDAGYAVTLAPITGIVVMALVDHTRTWITECGRYFPEVAASYERKLPAVEAIYGEYRV